MRKYLNYIIFFAVVLLVVALAVAHSRHMRSLVNELSGPDREAHVRAGTELIKSEQFADAITGEPPETRAKAARALADMDTGDAVKQALALLKDTDKNVRAQALQTLKILGPKNSGTVTELVNGLKDGDVNVRKGTIAALTDPPGQQGIGPRPDIVQAVLALMKKEAGARGPGGDVLGSSRFVSGGANTMDIPVLTSFMSDKDNGVKSAGADALGKIGDATAVPALIAVMHDPNTVPDVRRVVIGAIALIADRSGEPALTEAVTNPNDDNEARAQAATGLGKIGTPTAVATLIKALNDDDLKLRSAATAALARAGKSQDGKPANPTVLADLIEGLHAPQESVRIGAAEALQAIQAPEANNALTRALLDTTAPTSNPMVRAAAASAMGFPDNRAAIAPLIHALNDPDGDVAAAAKRALQAIGPASTSALLAVMQQGGSDALYAAQALGGQGAPVVPALQQAAASAPSTEQRWIAVALGEVGTAETRPALEQLAHSTDPNVAYVAQQQLNRIGVTQ